MDDKGYIMGVLSFLLIIPSIILLIVVVDMINFDEKSAEEVVKTGDSIPNSRIVLKNIVESRMNNLNANYKNNTGVTAKCIIKSLDSANDPFELEINSSISVNKDNISYKRDISQKISILGLNPTKRFSGQFKSYYDIPDPLPFIKCKNYGGVTVSGGRINYGSSLSNYLRKTGLKESNSYDNASSPLYIKKCPYDPYTSHGNSKFSTLKNCIENGYTHTQTRMDIKGIDA